MELNVDGHGDLIGTSAPAQTITVGTSPTASFTTGVVAPYRGLPYAGSPVVFDAKASTDANGEGIASYSWSFGDGSSATGVTATHAYRSAGDYTVTLTVGDSLGLSGSKAVHLTVSAPGRLSKVSLKRSGAHVYLEVAITGAGEVRVGSARIRLRRAGTASFKLKLSGGLSSALAAGRTITLREKLDYTPDAGPAVVKTDKLKLR